MILLVKSEDVQEASARQLLKLTAKRIYQAHFVSKSSDADMENTETQVWLDFAMECKYLSKQEYDDLLQKSEEVGRMLNHMIQNPESYLTTADKSKAK